MELVGQIGFSIVIVDDMGRALEEDSRVEVEGIHTWVVERRTQAVDTPHMQAAVDRRNCVVDRLQVAVGRRQMAAARRSQGVAESSHSPIEVDHSHAAVACRKQSPAATAVSKDPPQSRPGLVQRSCSSHQQKIGSSCLEVAAGHLVDRVRAAAHVLVVAIASLTTPQWQSFNY